MSIITRQTAIKNILLAVKILKRLATMVNDVLTYDIEILVESKFLAQHLDIHRKGGNIYQVSRYI